MVWPRGSATRYSWRRRPPFPEGQRERDPLPVTPETPALLALVFSAFVFVFSLFFFWRDWTFPLHTHRVGTAQVPLPPTHFNCHSLQSPVSHLQCSSPLPHAVFGFYLHSKTTQPIQGHVCIQESFCFFFFNKIF